MKAFRRFLLFLGFAAVGTAMAVGVASSVRPPAGPSAEAVPTVAETPNDWHNLQAPTAHAAIPKGTEIALRDEHAATNAKIFFPTVAAVRNRKPSGGSLVEPREPPKLIMPDDLLAAEYRPAAPRVDGILPPAMRTPSSPSPAASRA